MTFSPKHRTTDRERFETKNPNPKEYEQLSVEARKTLPIFTTTFEQITHTNTHTNSILHNVEPQQHKHRHRTSARENNVATGNRSHQYYYVLHSVREASEKHHDV